MCVAEDHIGVAEAEPVATSPIARSPARRAPRAEMSVRSGPSPARLSAATASGKPPRGARERADAARRLRARTRRASRSASPPSALQARTVATPLSGVAGASVPGDRVAPREHRGGHRLVVLDSSRRRGRAAQQTAHRADAQALDRRHRQMAVQVVAMHRVHVGAHPQARIGDLTRAGERPRGDPREHRRRLLRERAAARARAARAHLLARASEPRFDEQVVVVAGADHDSRPPSARPRSSKNGRAAASASRGGPWRSSSTSPSRPGGRRPPRPPAAPRAAPGRRSRSRPGRCRGAGRRRSACAGRLAARRRPRASAWAA